MLPELSRGFKWVEAAHRPALVCEALDTCADHLFTTRSWILGSAADGERVPGWDEIAGAIGVSRLGLVRARQVHGAAVVVHNKGRERGRGLEDADILVTDDSSVALAIQTADCVPLLIGDRRTGCVAAAHAGWRGLAARVPQIAVEALGREFGSRAGDLVAAIGPSISAPRYEVGAEVRVRFEQTGCTSEEFTRWFSQAGRPHHWYFDAWRAARDQLEAVGVAADEIHSASLCTASHPEVLCSYRRDGKGAGRIAAVIRARRVWPSANITIERRGPAFAQENFDELRPGKRKGRKERTGRVSDSDTLLDINLPWDAPEFAGQSCLRE